MREGIAAAVFLLAGCATSQANDPLNDAWFDAPITFETSSWGKITRHFQVAPDGTSEVWVISQPPGARFDEYTISKFRGRASDSALTRFKTTFSPYANHDVSKPGECKRMMTDAPYSWIGKDKRQPLLSLNSGCTDREFAEYANPVMQAVNDLRGGITLEAQPFEVLTYPPPRPVR